MDTKKNVLIISRNFPPLGGSSVQRPFKLTKFLPQFSWIPHVLTTKTDVELRDESFLIDLSNDVKVIRVFTPEPECLKISINRKWKNNNSLKLIMRVFLKAFSIIYYRVAIPDLSIGWVPFAYQKAKKIIKDIKINIIYVPNQPPSSLLIGYFLKKKFGIPLVLDYTDPWSTSEHYFPGGNLKRTFVNYIEKKILSAADCIVYCKKSIFDEIKIHYKNLDYDKFLFIPQGYDSDDFLNSPIEKLQSKFRFVYMGKLSNNFCYSPRSLFKALSSLIYNKSLKPEKIEVILAGQISKEHLSLIKRMNLQNCVRHLGYLSHIECIRHLKSADATILLMESQKGRKISTQFSGSMPAKIFEYLYTGKPILAIIPEGPEAEILKQAGIGFFANPNDPDSISNALLNLYHTIVTNRENIRPNWKYIRSFDRKKQTKKMAAIFNSLVVTGESNKYFN